MIAVMVSTLTSSGRYLHLVLLIFTLTKTTVPSTGSEANITASSNTSVAISTTIQKTTGNRSASTTEATTTFTTTPLTTTETTVPSTGSEATTTASSNTSVAISTTIQKTTGSRSASTTEATTTFMTTPLIPTAKGNGFDVEINTDTPAVEIGDSLNVTCRTTCLNPTIGMELKSGLNKYCLQVNNSNTCQFPVVDKWDLLIVCIVTCKSENNTQKEVKKEITVYNRDLVIAPHPEVMEINKTYQLHCTGPRVYPNNKLHLKWLRGNNVVKSVNSTVGKLPEDVTPLVNILDLIASKTDDGQVYTCLAELDLDTNTTKEINSSPVTLQTYFFSEPVIQAPLTIVVGKPVDITCSVFNASGKLQLALKNGNTILARASSSTELTIYHIVHPKMELNGQQLTCEAELTLQHHSEPIVKQQNTTLSVQRSEATTTASSNTSVPTSTTIETATGNRSASTTEATTTSMTTPLMPTGEELSRITIMGVLIFVGAIIILILIAIICCYRINRARSI